MKDKELRKHFQEIKTCNSVDLILIHDKLDKQSKKDFITHIVLPVIYILYLVYLIVSNNLEHKDVLPLFNLFF